jgi:hypothetical protein
MGECTFCGQSAGLLRSEHEECKQRNAHAEREIWDLALKLPFDPESLGLAPATIQRISKDGLVPNVRVRELLVAAWENAAAKALDDRLITADEIRGLVGFANAFGIDPKTLNQNHWWQRVRVAVLLRRLQAGDFPKNDEVPSHPFNLQKQERLVWTTSAIAYERRMKTSYVGGSQGVSIRIAKGLYYRTSAFKGKAVSSPHLVEIGRGTLGLTDKHVYFHSNQRSLRIAYAKVVGFEPYNDGIGVNQQAATSKPLVFVCGDGWSVFNLATSLAQRE